MRSPTLPLILTTLSILALLSLPALAADVEVQLPAGDGFVIKNNTGTSERLRVDEATGNISRNGALFVHTTGTDNTFVGEGAGVDPRAGTHVHHRPAGRRLRRSLRKLVKSLLLSLQTKRSNFSPLRLLRR